MSLLTKSRIEKTEDKIVTGYFSSIDQTDPGAFRDRAFHVYDSGYEYLFEVMTPNSDGNHTVWKNFQHYKRVSNSTVSMAKVTMTTDTGTSNWTCAAGDFSDCPSVAFAGQFGAPGKLLGNLPAFYDPYAEEEGFVPFPADIGAWQSASLRGMMPYIKSELSLLNSVYELKDFKSLPNQVRSVKGLIGGDIAKTYLALVNPKLYKILSKIPAGVTLRAYLHEAASGYLQAKFNVMPLLSDITAVYRSCVASVKRINDLIARQGQPRMAHFTKSFVENQDSIEQSSYLGLGGVGSHFGLWSTDFNPTGVSATERQVLNIPSVFHAQLEYNYNYARYQEALAPLLAQLDRLGVNLNPAIIWNAIPWSFVVDWVVGIGRALDDFKKGWMDPQVNIRRYLWSIKRSRMIYGHRLLRWASVIEGPCDINIQRVPLPATQETAYRRVVEMPTRASLFASGLDSNELTIGAALVIPRKWRRRRSS